MSMQILIWKNLLMANFLIEFNNIEMVFSFMIKNFLLDSIVYNLAAFNVETNYYC